MMKNIIEEILGKYEKMGVKLWVENNELRFKAPINVLNEERKKELRKYKEDIIEYLKENVAEVKHDEKNRYEAFPLTDIQSAYLIGRDPLYECGGVGCHGYIELTINGKINILRLNKAWEKVVKRHDMLRCKIYKEGYQKVERDILQRPIEMQDISGQTKEEQKDAVNKIRKKLQEKQYDPSTWPLYEIYVTVLDDRSIVHLSNDMLVIDFVGANIILNELGIFYEKPESKLPDLEVTFRDLLLYRKRMEGRVSEQQKKIDDKEYWNKELENVILIPEMPIENMSPETIDFEYRQFLISESKWGRICDFAKKRGITGANVLLTAFAEVIRLWSKSDQFCINMTLLDRPEIHSQIDDIVGDFTNVSILKVDLKEGKNFSDNARILQRRIWENLEHKSFSGVEVIRELGRVRKQNVMVPIVFTSTLGIKKGNHEKNILNSGEVTYKVSQTPQVYIDCQASESSKGIVINWDVRKGIFKESVVSSAFKAFEGILEKLAISEEYWQDKMVTEIPKEMLMVREESNNTTREVCKDSLITGFLNDLKSNPNKTAVIVKGIHYSYQLLADYAGTIKAKLQEKGFRKGDLGAVLLDKGIWQIAAVLGTLLAGGTYVPLDYSQPKERIRKIIGNANIEFLLTDKSEEYQTENYTVINPEILEVKYDYEPEEDRFTGSDLAYIIYTSGTTGNPKGVMITHEAAINTIKDINKKFNLNKNDVFMGIANLGFDLSVFDIFGCFMAGGTLVLPNPELKNNPEHWAELISKEHITVWNSVPAQMQLLLSEEKEIPNNLKVIMLSGDWIPVQLPRLIRNKLGSAMIISLGGATEASIWSIYHIVEEADEKLKSIPYGKPLANQYFKILNRNLQECPDYVVGDIYIGGKGLALGYYKDEALTKEKFKTIKGERWYYTGDTGKYDSHGVIEFCGREDTQVKIHGHRIELSEIESILQKNEKVASAAVLLTKEGQESRIEAFVSPAKAENEKQNISQKLHDRCYEIAERTTKDIDRELVQTWMDTANQTSIMDILAAFQRGDIFYSAEEKYTFEEVMTKLKVQPQFERLLKRWLNVLCKENIMKFDLQNATYQLDVLYSKDENEEKWKKLYEIESKLHYGTKLIQYLEESNKYMLELLQGDVGALDLFFPKGETDTAMAAYHDNIVNLALNNIAKESIINIVREYKVKKPKKTVRILEIGAGVGGTSVDLIPALDGMGVEYFFTDISNFFLNKAKETFKEYEWVKYGLFDINQDYIKQGIEPFSFDVIICANVLHNSNNINTVLRKLKEISKPDSYLIVIEATKEAYTLLTSMEFKEGLTGFTDFRKDSDKTFIEFEKWEALFRDMKMDILCSYPKVNDRLSEAGQSIFIIKFPKDYVDLEKEELNEYLKEQLPDYMIPASILLIHGFPLTLNGKIDRKRLLKEYNISKYQEEVDIERPRNDVETRVAQIWAKVLNKEMIGRNDNFYVIGGDSLLIAQVIGSMKDQLPEAKEWEWDELMREILQTPTVSGISKKLIAKRDKKESEGVSPCVLLAEEKEGNTAIKVMIHGGTGTLTSYNNLLGYMVNDNKRTERIVGFSFGNEREYLSLECENLICTLGERYANILMEMPASHYEIIGYCMGGLIAIETARVLLEAGKEVTKVTTIDTSFGQRASEKFISNEAQLNLLKTTLGNELLMERAYGFMIGADVYAAGHTVNDELLKEAINHLGENNNGIITLEALCNLNGRYQPVAECYKRLAQKTQEERLELLFSTLQKQEDKLETKQSGMLEVLFRVFCLNFQSVTNYEPKLFSGNVTVLRCKQKVKHFLPVIFPTDEVDWENVVLGNLKFEDIEGDHVSCMKEPYVRSLAQVLKKEITVKESKLS